MGRIMLFSSTFDPRSPPGVERVDLHDERRVLDEVEEFRVGLQLDVGNPKLATKHSSPSSVNSSTGSVLCVIELLEFRKAMGFGNRLLPRKRPAIFLFTPMGRGCSRESGSQS